MPHALIGYAGSTVRAAEMFHETFPDEPLTVLVDYFGREITDARRGLPALSRAGRRGPARASAWTRRAGAIARGSTSARSYEVLERHAPQAIRGYRTEAELRYLVGTGVIGGGDLAHAPGARRGRLPARPRSSPAPASARPNAG